MWGMDGINTLKFCKNVHDTDANRISGFVLYHVRTKIQVTIDDGKT
jgi:hypothetical protein